MNATLASLLTTVGIPVLTVILHNVWNSFTTSGSSSATPTTPATTPTPKAAA